MNDILNIDAYPSIYNIYIYVYIYTSYPPEIRHNYKIPQAHTEIQSHWRLIRYPTKKHKKKVSRDKDGCTRNSVPMVFSWCSLGILGIITHKYPLYRASIEISHRGTLVGVHPTIPLEVSHKTPLKKCWAPRSEGKRLPKKIQGRTV